MNTRCFSLIVKAVKLPFSNILWINWTVRNKQYYAQWIFHNRVGDDVNGLTSTEYSGAACNLVVRKCEIYFKVAL